MSLLDPNFPIREWDWLLFQAEITLNLLPSAKVNPKLSACAFLFGTFNYNKNPLVPPGIRVLAHSKPDIQASWDLNGVIGYVISPSLDTIAV